MSIHVLAHATEESTLGPMVLVPAALLVAVLAACHARGALRLLQTGRARRWRLLVGALGAAIALVTVLPPVENLAEPRYSTHMVQHMVLIVVAAPLLALGCPGLAVWVGLPQRVRRPLAWLLHRRPVRALRGVMLVPAVAWCGHVATLWLWHLPAAYDAALHSAAVHALEHGMFLGTAWLFWWHALAPSRQRLAAPFAALYVAVATPPSAALGAVLTFARTPLYPAQAEATSAAGVDVLTDQQLAGLIMWIPADVVYMAVALALFLRWFTGAEGETIGARPGAAAGVQR